MPTKKVKEPLFFQKIIQSYSVIKQNKLLFGATVLATLICISLMIFVIFIFSLSAIENLQNVFGYIESIPVDDPFAGPLGEDPLSIYQSIEGAKQALLGLGLFLVLLGLVMGGLNWLLTKFMVSKKKTLDFVRDYAVVFLSYVVPFGLLFYYTTKTSVNNALNGTPNPWLNLVTWILLLVVLYFYGISLGLTTNSKLKDIPQKTLRNAKNFTLTIPVYLVSLVLVVLFGVLINFFLEKSFLGLMLAILLFLASIAYSWVLFAVSFE